MLSPEPRGPLRGGRADGRTEPAVGEPEGGRRRVALPGGGCPGGRVRGGAQANPRARKPQGRGRAVPGEVSDPVLPRKTPRRGRARPVPETDAGGQAEHAEAIG